jgi:uncharacterized protein
MSIEQRLIDETRELIAAVRVGYSVTTAGNELQIVAESFDESEMVQRAKEDQVDGSATVTLSEDGMTALVSLFPLRGFGKSLDPDAVYEQLHEAGVVYGIRNDIVEESLFTCNTDRLALHSVEVAYGLPPSHGMPEHLRLVDRADPGGDNSTQTATDEPVDHRARSVFPLVEAGATLAVIEPEISGYDGTTVTGTVIPHQMRSQTSPEPGENVKISDKEVVAEISGLLHLEGGIIAVEPTLPLAEGIGYHTGNIDFDGDVMLGGRIADGFTVSCTGTLVATVTIDGFGISCGALSGSKGLICHGDTTVSVTGDASLRFVQNARIRVGGTLRVTHSVLKSDITAHNRVELAHGSSIVASTIRAGLGAEVFSIGAASAAASEIYLGIDFGIDERLATIRDQTLALSRKLREVRLANSRGEGSKGLTTLAEDLTAAIAVLAGEAGDLVSHLDRDEDATLFVHGAIHAGTYIEICHRSHLVERSTSRCSFRLDRKTGTILVEPLGKSAKGNKHDTNTGS